MRLKIGLLDVIGHPLGLFRISYWVRSDVSLYKAIQAAAIIPFLISTPPYGTTTPRITSPTLFDRYVGSLDAGGGAYGLKSLSEKT